MLRLTREPVATPAAAPNGVTRLADPERVAPGRARTERPHVAHLHLLSVINTESARFPPGHVVRILDAGCGGGRLIARLAEALPGLRPGLSFEFYGFDVFDRPSDSFGDAVQELAARVPDAPWATRIVRIPADAAWPYPDGFFDVILSNQVGEHLRDHGQFFGEVARCLSPRGFSVHLFPLKHVVLEWHIHIPYAHRIMNADLLRSFIVLCTMLGLAASRRRASRLSRAEFARHQAEYVVKYTSYIGYRDLLTIAKRHGLLASLRYTKEFYLQKLRQLTSRPTVSQYSRARSILGDWLLVWLLRYVSGVTVLLEKGERYHVQYHPTPTAE
jgi:SAM-dependent methyltransferase